jgi:hypothetical protein
MKYSRKESSTVWQELLGASTKPTNTTGFQPLQVLGGAGLWIVVATCIPIITLILMSLINAVYPNINSINSLYILKWVAGLAIGAVSLDILKTIFRSWIVVFCLAVVITWAII